MLSSDVTSDRQAICWLMLKYGWLNHVSKHNTIIIPFEYMYNVRVWSCLVGMALTLWFDLCSYTRYLATEGQIFPLFLLTYIMMLVCYIIQASKGLTSDLNGFFLLATFTLTVALTLVWSLWLWDDPVLRRKYPGILYVPEPWAYYTLHIAGWLKNSTSVWKNTRTIRYTCS